MHERKGFADKNVVIVPNPFFLTITRVPSAPPSRPDRTKRRPLCQPKQEEVVVVNADPRHNLTLFSLESKSEDFHATWPAGEVSG